MRHDEIERLCHSLMRKYKTNDPFELADWLGVHVEMDDIGGLKGYYCYMNRIRLIVINSRLDSRMKKLVCAHELGHDRLHSDLAMVSPLRDAGFISTAKPEIEANRFAAGLLVPDEDFFELASYGYTDTQIAMELNTFPEIVQIKANRLYDKGIQLRMCDMPKSDFIKRL